MYNLIFEAGTSPPVRIRHPSPRFNYTRRPFTSMVLLLRVYVSTQIYKLRHNLELLSTARLVRDMSMELSAELHLNVTSLSLCCIYFFSCYVNENSTVSFSLKRFL